MTITRYYPDFIGTREDVVGMLPDAEGDYVEYTDHIALVAAAYRDAADKAFAWMTSKDEKIVEARIDANMQILTGEGSETADADLVQTAITVATPADAEAHLTALLRAEYERGVREAADKCNALRDHEDTTDEEARGAMFCASDILALLTQEGR